MEYKEGYKELAASIVEAVIYDYKHNRNKADRDYYLRWFTTNYGSDICTLAGIDPDYVKECLIQEVL